MKYNISEGSVWAVRAAYAELLDLITQSASGEQCAVDIKALHEEAEQFVCAMVAAVTLADGRITEDEARFIHRLLNIGEAPGAILRYANEQASVWSITYKSIPRFFSMAASHDREIAQAMLQSIQAIGNNSAIPDMDFATEEAEVVRDCISRLETSLA